MDTTTIVAIFMVLANSKEIRDKVEHEVRLICKDDYDLEMVADEEGRLWFKQKNRDFLMEPCDALGKGLRDVICMVTMCIAGRTVGEVLAIIDMARRSRC